MVVLVVEVLAGAGSVARGVDDSWVEQAASAPVIAYLREKSPFYVYSNPITPGEAAAAGCYGNMLSWSPSRGGGESRRFGRLPNTVLPPN